MKTPGLALACLAVLLAQPLFAADPGATPGKSAAILLEDGRTATITKGKLMLVDKSGKITPAPAGTYTAKNGVIWTVDAAGQAHALRAVRQNPVQSGSPGQQPAPVVSGTFVPFPPPTPPKSPQAGAVIRHGSSTPVPTPPKLANSANSKFLLEDGSLAVIVNGRLLVQGADRKFSPAPAGSYTTKNGTVYTVAAGGQIAGNGAEGRTQGESRLAEQPVGTLPAAAKTRSGGSETRELRNVPAALNGLKIFRPGNANQELMTLKMKTVSAMLNSLPGLAAQANVNTNNPAPAQPGQSPSPVQPAQGPIVITPANLFQGPNWVIGFLGAGAGCYPAAPANPPILWIEDAPNSCLLLAPGNPQAGKYYLIDFAVATMRKNEQFTVTGPDGSTQTFQNLQTGPDSLCHLQFGYYAAAQGTPGPHSPYIIVAADGGWNFLFVTITPEGQ